jgi:uncharacterized protein (TIGR00369 family)
MADPNHLFFQWVRGEAPWPPGVQLLGQEIIEAEVGSGEVKVRFKAKPELANVLGKVHGGFISAMLDVVTTNAAATTMESGEIPVTIELKVNYIQPVKIGVVLGFGRVVHRGKSTIFLEGNLRSPENALVATASATVRVIKHPIVST